MKKIEIKKGSAKFLRAYTSQIEVERWWQENPNSIGIAMVGRSNVGKSSLINAMYGAKTAKTSKTPGRTQAINIFSFELTKDEEKYQFFLYDLPGYGHAEVSRAMSKNWMAVMDSFFRNLNNRTMLLNIQDARHPNQSMDQSFYTYIDDMGIDIFLIFNKIDKLKKQKDRAALNKLKPKLAKEHPSVVDIKYVSAEKKTGLDQLEEKLVEYFLKNKEEVIEENLDTEDQGSNEEN